MKRPIIVMFNCLLVWLATLFASECGAAPLPQSVGSGNNDSCLPFSMPDASVLFNSSKKVFAHYFYPFPLSMGNKSASDDYYSVMVIARATTVVPFLFCRQKKSQL